MCINWINAQKVDVRVELTKKKKTSHCKSRDFLRKRRLKSSLVEYAQLRFYENSEKSHKAEKYLRGYSLGLNWLFRTENIKNIGEG